MNQSSRFPAVFAYIPILGWLYVYLLQRQNSLAIYHLRQAIGLCLFLIAALVVWAVIAWVIAWIPYMAVMSAALFALVIVVYIYGVIAWIIGLLNVANNRLNPLPVFGNWAARLPIN
jgi:uncharacterized membrane protein